MRTSFWRTSYLGRNGSFLMLQSIKPLGYEEAAIGLTWRWERSKIDLKGPCALTPIVYLQFVVLTRGRSVGRSVIVLFTFCTIACQRCAPFQAIHCLVKKDNSSSIIKCVPVLTGEPVTPCNFVINNNWSKFKWLATEVSLWQNRSKDLKITWPRL